MLGCDIRNKFLNFFKSKGHEIVPSDSLVPHADTTLLFTSAGMNQFKEQFLGKNIRFGRVASCQKCLRTGDLDKVGRTSGHHTFFEMLGNFSFGDYFKKEAIYWAWEFMTEILNIRDEKLWVSVYKDDKEAYTIWSDLIRIPKTRIIKLGAVENFWPSNAPLDGPDGPCGPCSEIFYDWGSGVGCGRRECDPSCSCGRFVEVWNLVFTQFDRRSDGSLKPLPSKNIDTGMGLERITAVMQGVKSNFETDLFQPIIEAIRLHLCNKDKFILNAIADHIRAVTFAIADNIIPSNEERGYVVRKLIRRALLYSNLKEPFLFRVVPKICGIMKESYPVLMKKREEISFIVKEEEEKFLHTLSVAMPILRDNISKGKSRKLKGDIIFRLVDTYGLPLDIIRAECKKKGIILDEDGFNELMEARRRQSKMGSKIEESIFARNIFAEIQDLSLSDELPLRAVIVAIGKDKMLVDRAEENDIVELITNPQAASFYAEAGGQVGDTGTIEILDNGKKVGCFRILNTIKSDGKLVHIAELLRGKARCGDSVLVKLDKRRKEDIARNHTATHLLQSALRKVLGEHVHQAGSLVAQDRLRFDFTHMRKLNEREIDRIESMVNEIISEGIEVRKEEKSIEEAKNEGAIALFNEKYSERVTVVFIGDFSKEVCGGTHVKNTEDIESFKIIRESAVGSGLRRIEALTGRFAREWLKKKKKEKQVLLEKEKEREKKKAFLKERLKSVLEEFSTVLEKAEIIDDVKIIIAEIKNANIDLLRSLADVVKAKEKSYFLMLICKGKEKVYLILSVSANLVSEGIKASAIVKQIAGIINGSGGGRDDFAQAGGSSSGKIQEMVFYTRQLVGDLLRRVREK